jgi:hypothetical protein
MNRGAPNHWPANFPGSRDEPPFDRTARPARRNVRCAMSSNCASTLMQTRTKWKGDEVPHFVPSGTRRARLVEFEDERLPSHDFSRGCGACVVCVCELDLLKN